MGQLNYDKNTKRLMFTENNLETSEWRHFSLQYPFNIKCDEENYRISLQSSSNEFEIYSVHIQILRCVGRSKGEVWYFNGNSFKN